MKLTVGVEIFFNFSKSECQFPHPVDAAAHAAGGEVDLGGGGVGAEPVRVEVVAGEVLPVIIAGHVVYVDLAHLYHHIYFKAHMPCYKWEGNRLRLTICYLEKGNIRIAHIHIYMILAK